MTKLIYGKNGQVKFNNEEEKKIAFEYLLTSDNVDLKHEDNQNQGAWSYEKRIHFFKVDGIPESLKRQLTKGTSNIHGRINCNELVEELIRIKNSKKN